MDRNNLIDFINSFDKEKGEYTSDELYQIGIAHKSIELSQRNWEWLAEYVGYKGKPEVYRSWVKNIQAKKKALGINTESERQAQDKITELYKQKVATNDVLNEYKRALRDEARVENFKNLLAEQIALVEKLPKIRHKKNTQQTIGREAILLLSDLHIGAWCDNFYNKYSVEIAHKRLNKLLNDTLYYIVLHKVSTLHVCNLGDLIHGIIHTNTRIGQQINVVEQIITASEYLAQFLNELCNTCCKVVYRSVTDNHSRVMANKEEAIEKESFTKLIDWYLQERLKDTKIKFANDNIDDTIGKFTCNGKSIMFAHGHLDNINQAYQNFTGATKEHIDYILLGHYHCEKAKSFQGTKVIVNGSIVGTEQYALSKRLFSEPSQTLLILDSNNLINISIGLGEK